MEVKFIIHDISKPNRNKRIYSKEAIYKMTGTNIPICLNVDGGEINQNDFKGFIYADAEYDEDKDDLICKFICDKFIFDIIGNNDLKLIPYGMGSAFNGTITKYDFYGFVFDPTSAFERNTICFSEDGKNFEEVNLYDEEISSTDIYHISDQLRYDSDASDDINHDIVNIIKAISINAKKTKYANHYLYEVYSILKQFNTHIEQSPKEDMTINIYESNYFNTLKK